MGSFSKYQTTVVGAHSVPDWFVRAERVPGRDVCPPRILQKSLFSGTLQHRTGWLTTLVK
jgi:hypothetical protein